MQQSPWLSITNKQLEIMGRYMAELGLTPVARSRVALPEGSDAAPVVDKIRFVVAWQDEDGVLHEKPLGNDDSKAETAPEGQVTRIDLDPRL